MYYSEGFIKKFLLDKKEISIGWDDSNDLVIKDDMISGFHLKVDVDDEKILIKDLDSTNGTFFKGGKVRRAEVKLGESFSIGSRELILRKGDLEEFKASKDLIPVFESLNKEIKKKIKKRKTKYLRNIYNEVLKQILKTGLNSKSFNQFILSISHYLSIVTDLGSLFLIKENGAECDILLSTNGSEKDIDILKIIKNNYKNIFSVNMETSLIPGTKKNFYSFIIKLKKKNAALIYIEPENKISKDLRSKTMDFLCSFSNEISMLSKIIPENGNSHFDKKDNFVSKKVVGKSNEILNLIDQADKIAKSDIFVLIQGESGTGKELFARIIHENSNRRKGKFVAINCAAIPEQLLEAEFFGYEKGAFTGAYAQKKGKLELACGGTLVLDEIGDMPFSLQSRLLRALQENEFYRVGGTMSVKVDLRIVSLTNKNLRELISDGKFREDLYYRLVHHVMEIPPIRERSVDISVLINHFTTLFSKKTNKQIRGYSIKALKALQGYYWPGNIRQLKNEINRIVNLTDEGEIIGFDILSNEIKTYFSNETKKKGKEILRESEIDYITRILRENGWNKTHSAAELGMTYRGLHKKMKRLGIEKPDF